MKDILVGLLRMACAVEVAAIEFGGERQVVGFEGSLHISDRLERGAAHAWIFELKEELCHLA